MDERWGKKCWNEEFFFHLTPLCFSMNLFSTSESPHTMLYFIVELLQINIARKGREEKEKVESVRRRLHADCYIREKKETFFYCKWKKKSLAIIEIFSLITNFFCCSSCWPHFSSLSLSLFDHISLVPSFMLYQSQFIINSFFIPSRFSYHIIMALPKIYLKMSINFHDTVQK